MAEEFDEFEKDVPLIEKFGSEFEDTVDDWEMLGMDPDSSQEEIDAMWENQM